MTSDKIDELLLSNNIDDVVLGIKLAHNLFGEEYFKSKGFDHHHNVRILIKHNIPFNTDKAIIFNNYFIIIFFVNIWYHGEKYYWEPELIIYDDR